MAHFAEIDENNIVIRVLVVNDKHEHRGQDFLANDLGLGGTWVQTSYNGNIRGKFAGIGDIYNAELDRFIVTKPFESWLLDVETFNWTAPVPYPDDGLSYNWDEETLNWVQLIEEAEDGQ